MNLADKLNSRNIPLSLKPDKKPVIIQRRSWRRVMVYALLAMGIFYAAFLHGKTATQATLQGNSRFYKRSMDTSCFDTQIRDIGDKKHLSVYANLVPMISINNDPFFKKTNVRRLFAVGDVHGCLKEFNTLLTEIQYDYDLGDRLILLGDLVNKGPDSVGVVRRANEVKALCVRGNQDDVLIRIMGYLWDHMFPVTEKSNLTMPEGPVVDPILFSLEHWQIARNMTYKDYEYLSSCPIVLGIPALKSVFVHAGLDPRKSLKNQNIHLVMNMRSILPDGTPTEERGLPLNWSEEWNYFQYAHMSAVEKPYINVYYGHDSVRGLRLEKHTFGLDSGCVFGGALSALELKSGELTQIPCGTYAPPPAN